MVKETKIRVEYYEPTASDGTVDLLAHKMRAILKSVKEPDREFKCEDCSINFDATENTDNARFVGSIRLLRKTTPRKGEIGTNKTEEIGLGSNEGICEITSFVYDYSKNKIAIQYNYHGPKILHLFMIVNSLYSQKFDHGAPRCSYVPIIVGSKIDLALESNDIRCIVAQPKTPVADGLIAPDASWQELRSIYNLPIMSTVRMEFKNRQGGLEKVLRLLLRDKHNIELYDKLSIRMADPESGKVNTYDLVENKLKEELRVPIVEKGTSLNTDALISLMLSAFDKTAEKYNWSSCSRDISF